MVQVAPETLRLTNLGDLISGSPVNLERAAANDGRNSGHMVQVHLQTRRTLTQTHMHALTRTHTHTHAHIFTHTLARVPVPPSSHPHTYIPLKAHLRAQTHIRTYTCSSACAGLSSPFLVVLQCPHSRTTNAYTNSMYTCTHVCTHSRTHT